MIFFELVTVNSRFKKDLNLQIYLHKNVFSKDQFLESVHKSYLCQTTLDLRKEKWGFLKLTVIYYKHKILNQKHCDKEYLNMGPLVLLLQQGILQTPKCVTFPRGILEFALSTRIELDLSASCTAEDSHSEVLLLRSLYKIYTKERK